MGIIIYPPIINWDYMRQRPQQLMLQFARNNHTVLYFNKTAQAGPIVTNPADNLYVIHHATSFLNYIYPLLFKENMKVYWSSWSKMIPFHTAFDADFLIYDCVDDFPEWEGEERHFSDMCNAIVCTADKLEEKMKSFFPTKPVYKIPNGCDWEYFSTLLSKPTIASSHLRIGYIGAWAPWVDADLVREVAIKFPGAEIKIIGPDLRGDTDTFPENVHFFGHVQYENLLDHLSSIDVLILPFSINRITESTNPIKIYEYLATGRPVVSTNLPEVQKMSSVVHVAENTKQFMEKIEIAYANRREGRERRANYAKQFSWEERFRQITEMLQREYPLFSSESIDVRNLVDRYVTRSVPMEYCTVNSYYKDHNLRHDPIFVGMQGEYEYQCYFKSKQTSILSNVIRVYFEIDFTGDIEGEFIVSAPAKPWFTHQLTFGNRPAVEHLFNQRISETFVSTVTFDVTEYIQQGKISMFHLRSDTQKVFRFANPRLTFVIGK